ncbi:MULTISPECIES: GNAT family N-acetyltransferase [unclassified Streptomyces]|uniref:GNAT family N-acetyltransferase n=1 Tax=unclassified Streptomyces TaxID=2593676 RepID=UPI000452E5AF|nr:GNAT family protein [Streptomyces sp. PCS3-D2]WKV71719.1 GNAT family N-acetyltransferase [Streptomyces sp. PCS3-D2]
MFSIDLAEGAQLFPLEARHAEEFYAHIERGREFIGQYVGFPDRSPDVDSARDFLAKYAVKAGEDGARFFGIRLDGTLVGGVLFPNFDAAGGNCEIGCWLEPAAAGRGLVTKACRVLIDYAFAERGMHRVEWHAATGNKKSLAVAERLGMTREGVLRENYLHRGVRQDTEVWSILAREWADARTS